MQEKIQEQKDLIQHYQSYGIGDAQGDESAQANLNDLHTLVSKRQHDLAE